MPVKRADKTPMPVRDAHQRAHDFVEVNTGYTEFHAGFEAERCLRCQDPVCVGGCPVQIPIPEFVHAVAAGDMARAAKILRSANPLPAICGRVCPQESQCEAECSMTNRFEPVAIGHLERAQPGAPRPGLSAGGPPLLQVLRTVDIDEREAEVEPRKLPGSEPPDA